MEGVSKNGRRLEKDGIRFEFGGQRKKGRLHVGIALNLKRRIAGAYAQVGATIFTFFTANTELPVAGFVTAPLTSTLWPTCAFRDPPFRS
jgi:hypothetical protein